MFTKEKIKEFLLGRFKLLNELLDETVDDTTQQILSGALLEVGEAWIEFIGIPLPTESEIRVGKLADTILN